MVKGSISGCRITYSSFSARLGIPYPFECTSDISGLESVVDIVSAVKRATVILTKIMGDEVRVSGVRGWEYSGGRFNLYSFGLEDVEGRPYGVIRAVESGGYLINVSGALTGISSVYSETLDGLREGEYVEEGYNLGVVLLDRPSSELRAGMPPGQKAIKDFVIYAAEGVPSVDSKRWKLKIDGLVENPLELTYSSLLELAENKGSMDFHCVTGWSVPRVRWEGVPVKHIISMARPKGRAEWAILTSVGGYSTVVPLKELERDDALIVVFMNGKPLSKESGFPVRLFAPRLYGWKHAKWLSGITLLDRYADGYWEALSYHERGYVLFEERFKIRNTIIASEGRLLGKPRPLKP